MQYTENYSLRKPQMAETASVSDLNYNSDRIDAILADDRQISVAMYVSGNTYNTGDLVGYENPSTHHIRVYRCLVDNVTGVWDSTKWTLTNLADEILDAKASGGTEVEANPTGTPSDTMHTVGIDGVIYAVGGDVDVTKTASGNPIEVSDSASAPLVKCVTQITGYQEGSGTPSPDNIRPITAYTEGKIEVRGKNLLKNNKYLSGNTLYLGENANNTFSTKLKAGTYKLSYQYNGSGTPSAYYQIYNGGGNISISDNTITVDFDCIIRIWLYKSGIQSSEVTDFQLELGTSATAYEPYTSTTHTTTYPSAIYRGSEDVVNGSVSTEKVVIEFDGSSDEDWGVNTPAQDFYIIIPNSKRSTIICNAFKGVAPVRYDSLAVGECAFANGGDMYVNFHATHGDMATWKSYLASNPLQVVYEPNIPTTEQISPTNLPVKSLNGYSHIESSTGDMEIEYITQEYQPLVDLISDSGGGGGSSTLAGLDDVDITTPSDGQLLVYDDTNDEWVNGNIAGVNVQPVIYSTEEREVGVWKDNKPLYEKTIVIPSFPSTSPISIDVSSLSVETPVSITGEAYAISGGSIVETIILPSYTSSSYYSSIRFINNNIQILHKGLNDYTSGVVTIRYTKTTDTPGSGTWTPSGVPAVHYSTDEQVVGTWIGGETIYEKTYAFGTDVRMDNMGVDITQYIDNYSSINTLISAIAIYSRTTSSVSSIYLSKNNSSPYIKAWCAEGGNFTHITIRYTKTTV